MKKVTFLFVGIVYFFAIIFVAFLGAQAEIANETITVERIVLKEAENLGKGEHIVYPADREISQSVYTLFARPEENEIDPKTGIADNVVWNLSETVKFDYVIQIRDFNTVCDSPSWKYGPMHFDVGAFVLPENATMQKLRYSIGGSAGTETEAASIDDLGVVTFKEKTKSITTYIVTILPTDNSQAICRVRFLIRGYKE